MKTYKRELAVALLLWLVYVTEVKDATIVEILVWPIFSFAAAAFGFDQYAKLQQGRGTQSSDRGRTQRSGQYTGGENQYPNGGDDK